MTEPMSTAFPRFYPAQWHRSLVVLALFVVGGSGLSGQETPEQRYFDWAGTLLAAGEFADRRARAATALGSGNSILLIPSGEGLSAGSSFRQEDHFNYFTGLEVPRSVLAIRSGSREAILFAPRRDFRFESASRQNDFPGRPLADDPELARRTGLTIVPAESLVTTLADWSRNGATLRVAAPAAALTPKAPTPFVQARDASVQLAEYVRTMLPSATLSSGWDVLVKVRGIKTSAEIAQIGQVTRLTAHAIARAAGFVRPGVTERELEAEFEAECKRGGGQRIPFHPIVKSGPNSLWPWRVLASHYDRRNRAMSEGELVIFDVGCELDHYVSDVGRTFPVSGRFTDRQREILEMEVGVADRVIEAIRPGVTFADLRAVADAAIPPEHRTYMQAALFYGHHIGTSTGDPIDEQAPLEAGMVFTVEPWYYNHVEDISVFTEDVVVVTATGAEVLSRDLPRTADELEALVGTSR